MTLSKEDRFLLEWLAKEDASKFGECHGPALDRLMLNDLVQINGVGWRAAVTVTEAGHKALQPTV